MEEALQDIPPLVHDIQERLRGKKIVLVVQTQSLLQVHFHTYSHSGLSDTVAVDSKPRAGLPNRRLLWDVLKPKASAVSYQ